MGDALRCRTMLESKSGGIKASPDFHIYSAREPAAGGTCTTHKNVSWFKKIRHGSIDVPKFYYRNMTEARTLRLHFNISKFWGGAVMALAITVMS